MSTVDCLIVDDEADIRELIELTVLGMGLSSRSAADLNAAKNLLKSHTFRVCLTDMKLPDGNGLDLIKHIDQNHPQTPTAMITAYGNMECAIQALKAGAFDFVSKPVDLKVLRSLIKTALRLTTIPPASPQTHGKHELLGNSESLQAIRRLIHKLARNQAPVHITGESGTGKELAARMIHDQGPRGSQPFIAVNCGAIPKELMESEFFGHTKGSFTGATSDKKGLFQQAEGGTLFLDEIADLPLDMQVKLLRAIQEKSVRPIGAQSEIPVDIRIISATHKNLQQMVQEGDFRQDLFFRINVIELDLPALREHKEDLDELIDFFLEKIAASNQQNKPKLLAAAHKQLLAYDFPGNVRELENILEGAFALHENGKIEVNDLKLNRKTAVSPQPESPPQSLDLKVSDLERSTIRQYLDEMHWNRTKVAQKMGLTLRQLRYKMEKLGLSDKNS